MNYDINFTIKAGAGQITFPIYRVPVSGAVVPLEPSDIENLMVSIDKQVLEASQSGVNVTAAYSDVAEGKHVVAVSGSLNNASFYLLYGVRAEELGVPAEVTAPNAYVSLEPTGEGTIEQQLQALRERMTAAEGDIDDLEAAVLGITTNYATKAEMQETLGEILAAIQALPDGQAVSAQVALNTAAIEALQGEVSQLGQEVVNIIGKINWLPNFYAFANGQLTNGGVIYKCSQKIDKRLVDTDNLFSILTIGESSSFVSFWKDGAYLGFYKNNAYYNPSSSEVEPFTEYSHIAISVYVPTDANYEQKYVINLGLSNLYNQTTQLKRELSSLPEIDWLPNFYAFANGQLTNGGVIYKCSQKIDRIITYIDKTKLTSSDFLSFWKDGIYIGYYKDGNYYNGSSSIIEDIVEFDEIAINVYISDNPDYTTTRYINSVIDVDRRVANIEKEPVAFWKNKKIGFLGDSITAGAYFDEQGGHTTDRPYTLVVGEVLDAMTVNYGVTGTSISGTSTIAPNNSFTHRYVNMANDLDMIVVLGGTNDFSLDNGVVLGTDADTTDISFYGAMDVLCRGLLTKYPPKRIVFITPLLRDFVHGGAEGVPNDRGFTIEQVRQAIIDVAQNRYGLYVINGKSLGLSPFSPNKTDYMYDGLHPNPLGYEMLGKNLAHILSAL